MILSRRLRGFCVGYPTFSFDWLFRKPISKTSVSRFPLLASTVLTTSKSERSTLAEPLLSAQRFLVVYVQVALSAHVLRVVPLPYQLPLAVGYLGVEQGG